MTTGQTSNFQAISACLRSMKSDIILRWSERVRDDQMTQDAPAAPCLEAYIPRFLDDLASLIESEPERPADEAGRSLAAARTKALAEVIARDYSVPEAVRELSHLRSALIEICLGDWMASEAAHLIHAAIDEAMSATAQSIALSRMSAVEKLKSSEHREKIGAQRLQALAGTGVVGFILANTDGRILDVNDCFLEMTGYTRADIDSGHLRWSEITPGEWSHVDRSILSDLETTGYAAPRRKAYICADGSVLPVMVGVAKLPEGGGASQAIVLDLSDQVRAEQALRTAKEAAETANRLKSAFLANISHEIRTPVGVMVGYSELLMDEQTLAMESRDFLGKIIRNGHQLTRLINDILDLSKIEADHLDLNASSVAPRLLLQEVSDSFQVIAASKGLALSLSPATIPPSITVRTDPTRLQQVVVNLVDNALKFTERGSVTLTASITHTDDQKLLTIEVSDTGIGITGEQMARVFDPFVQADVSMTRQYGGTGLGLTLSKNLCRRLGGDLNIAWSEPGRGTTMCAFVDADLRVAGDLCIVGDSHGDTKLRAKRKKIRRTDTSSSVSPQSGRPPAAEQPLGSCALLLAEDNPDNRLLILRILKRAGAQVDVAENGQEAIDKVREQDYDAIVMDIQMPFVDGNEATKTLRDDGYKLPIVALTAHAMTEERRRSEEAGVSAFLSKPVDSKELVGTVKRLWTAEAG